VLGSRGTQKDFQLGRRLSNIVSESIVGGEIDIGFKDFVVFRKFFRIGVGFFDGIFVNSSGIEGTKNLVNGGFNEAIHFFFFYIEVKKGLEEFFIEAHSFGEVIDKVRDFIELEIGDCGFEEVELELLLFFGMNDFDKREVLRF
jgi:hypothetical protein